MYNEHYFEDYRDDDQSVTVRNQLDHISDHLEVVLSELYGSAPVDLDRLENSLEEVSHGLGMRLPTSDLTISRKSNKDTSLCQKVIE